MKDPTLSALADQPSAASRPSNNPKTPPQITVLALNGRPEALSLEGAPAQLVPYREDLDLGALGNGEIVAGSPETTMRTALEVRHETGRAMPLLDGGGRLIGVIGAAELLAALVHRGAGLKPSRDADLDANAAAGDAAPPDG